MPEHRGQASGGWHHPAVRCRQRRRASRAAGRSSLGHLVCPGQGLQVAMLICWLLRCSVPAALWKTASSLDSQASASVSRSPSTPSRRSRAAAHGVRHGQQRGPIPSEWTASHPAEDAPPRTPGRLLPGHALQRQQFHQPAAHHGGLAHRDGAAPVRAAVSSRAAQRNSFSGPTASRPGGRSDLPVQPKPGRS